LFIKSLYNACKSLVLTKRVLTDCDLQALKSFYFIAGSLLSPCTLPA
jgi:hypothetical protein